MKPSLKSIRKYLYPELNNPTEVCLYYHDDDSWHNGTETSTPNLCTHKFGYNDIMGHTHPKRISGHPVEVNYSPLSKSPITSSAKSAKSAMFPSIISKYLDLSQISIRSLYAISITS